MRRILPAALVGLVLFPAAATAAPRVTAAPGRVSVTFDESRRLQERIGALVAAPDGSVLAAGSTRSSNRLAIMTLRANGSLGRSAVAPFDVREGDALVRAADGTLIAVGRLPSANGSSLGAPAAVRVRPDGSFDASYGGDGRGEVPGVSRLSCLGCQAAALQADGGVLVAGFAGRDPDENRFAVARLRADGSADPAFGTGGVSLPLTGTGAAGSIAVQAGRIVVLGNRGALSDPDAQQTVLVGLRPDGSLDPAFGTQGVVEVPANVFELAQDAAGRLLVLTVPLGTGESEVLRYTPAGALDASWGGDGRVALGEQINGTLLPTAAGVVVADAIVGGPVVQVRLDDAGGVVARRTTRLPFGGGSFPRGGTGPLGSGSFFGQSIVARADGSLAVGGSASIVEDSEGDVDEISQVALALVRADGKLARTITSGRPRIGASIRHDRLGAIRRRRALRVTFRPRRRGLARIAATARGRTIARGMAPFWTTRRTTVHVPLTRTGRQMVAAAGRLRVRVTAQANDLPGNRTTIRARATLRR
jgi:uncharacterized delta-60 repeat protein